ncbi:porin family protein [Sphingobacterium sp. SYP-B4668]|uniref:porin family protein n=1 Tax=Sphingobacterium sp. SYP-B4668 TaxID=2996035 RepID=UPI0022DDED7A|nr:porin family protein [Sphingobacterium sp. SYP-B4668]
MNRKITFLLTALSFVKVSYAQERKVSYEVQAGTVISDIKRTLNDAEAGVGTYARGLMDFNLSPMFSIQTGLGYRLSNFKSEYGNAYWTNDGYVFSPHGKMKIRTHWLDVPLNAKFTFALGNDRIAVTAGPYASLLVGGRMRDVETGENVKLEFDKFSDRLDYGANIGVSYIIKERLSLNAMYSFGLKDHDSSKDFKEQFRTGYLGAGYKF